MGSETPDIGIWKYARDNGYAIITADADFIDLARTKGAPPKVIRLERMNYTTALAANLIRKNAIRIFEFERSPESVLIFGMISPAVMERSLPALFAPHGACETL